MSRDLDKEGDNASVTRRNRHSFHLGRTGLSVGCELQPGADHSTGWNKCSGADFAALANDFCQTTAFFEPNSLATEFSNNPGGISVIFGAGFDAWNNTNNKSNNPLRQPPRGGRSAPAATPAAP